MHCFEFYINVHVDLYLHVFLQFMHCFEGHHVSTLGEITSNSGGHHVQVNHHVIQVKHHIQVRKILLLKTCVTTRRVYCIKMGNHLKVRIKGGAVPS